MSRTPPGAGFAPSPFGNRTVVLSLVGVLLAVSAALLFVGFTRPELKLSPLANAYQQAGSFSYTAAETHTSTVYPASGATTGDPLYPSLVKIVNFTFNYQFHSELPHRISGTIGLRAVLYSQVDTWAREFVVTPATPFHGDIAELNSRLPLAPLLALMGTVSTSSGIPEDTFVADVTPFIHIKGHVNGTPIDEKFAPALPFQVTRNAITLDASVAPAVPGATYVAPTEASSIKAALNPITSYTIPYLADNYVTVAKYTFTVARVRRAGEIIAGLALVVFAGQLVARRRRNHVTNEALVAYQLHSFVVPVDSLSSLDGQSVIEVESFADLAKLAQYLERPILVETRAPKRLYALDDDLHRYTFLATDTKRDTDRNQARSLRRRSSGPTVPS
jgi:hypothetical protein